MKLRVCALLVSFAALGGCSHTKSGFFAGGTSAHPPHSYRASATVLQRAGGPAMLCLGPIMTSDPPMCGGRSIPNWDWSTVTGETASYGTTWGEYTVVGTLGDNTFTVSDVQPPGKPTLVPAPRFDPPCPTPAGGWRAEDPARATDEAMNAANDTARASDLFGGFWIYNPDPPGDAGAQDPKKTVVNVTFTDAPENHIPDIKKVWGGALCVTRVAHTHAELKHIQDSYSDAEFGTTMMSIGVDDERNQVNLGVELAPDDLQARLDRKYGRGVVHLTAALEPVN